MKKELSGVSSSKLVENRALGAPGAALLIFILLLSVGCSSEAPSPNVVEGAELSLSAGFEPAEDAAVHSGNPTTNFGNTSFLTAGAWTAGGAPVTLRSTIRFDLSNVPTGAKVSRATLKLRANLEDRVYGQGKYNSLPPGHSNQSGPASFSVRSVTSPWSEASLTWTTFPSTTTVDEVIAPAPTSESQNYELDVSRLVQRMVDEPSSNYGFELRLVSEAYYREVTFGSRESASLDRRPFLEVDYAPKASGFADLHLHMMAEEAHGGRWLFGGHMGALHDCDGGLPPSDHGRMKQDVSELVRAVEACGNLPKAAYPLFDAIARGGGAVLSEAFSDVNGTQGDTGLHIGRRDYPDEFPAWDTIAHQQAHGDWLKAAHDRGLSLFVMSAVSSEFLCTLLPPQNGRPNCDEMVDLKLQIQMARAFDAANSWVEIATSAGEARRIIREGKLAMVLSLEASELFRDSKNWRTEFEEFYRLGVRTLQPVHELDNRFAGASIHQPVLELGQYVKNCHVDTDCGKVVVGFDVRLENGVCENTKGLTLEGRELALEMMKRGMLIDGAHLSNQSFRDLIDIAEAKDFYPIYISHGHPQEVMASDVAETEKASQRWLLEKVRSSGGMFGLRTFHNDAKKYEPSGVEATCAGSSRSFAQALDYLANGVRVKTAFGTDLNGMVQQTRPRFGDDACSATMKKMGLARGEFEAEAHCEQATQRRGGPSGGGSAFDTKGLGHIGLLPDMLEDLKRVGADTRDLETSAENFIRMWERAEGSRRGPVDGAASSQPGTIEGYEELEERFDDYPTHCNRPYCPDYQTLGGSCRFDAECESQQCANIGVSCGLDEGKCVCNDDRDCAGGEFCLRGVPGASDNVCEAKRSNHASCNRDEQCQSESCGGCFNRVGYCYVANSLAVGGSCVADHECRSERCSADCYVNPIGRCLCSDDLDCGPNQFCGTLLNSGKCIDKRSKGTLCSANRQCASGKCRITCR